MPFNNSKTCTLLVQIIPSRRFSSPDILPLALPPQDAILSAISALKDSAPGPSGWTPQLLCIAAEVPECLAMLHCLCSEIAAGTAPVPELFCASVLVAIPKKDGKVRPLAIGELVYRVLFKLLLRTNEWGKLLLDYQLGVGSRGGVEPVTRWIDLAAEGRLPPGITHLAALDFSNAFNSIDRLSMADAIRRRSKPLYRVARWAYGTPSDLLLRGCAGRIEGLKSAQGVRQGDPLGPLLFSIAIRQLLEDLEEHLGPQYRILAYLDDIHIMGPDNRIAERVAEFLQRRDSSIALNLAKCRTMDLAQLRTDGFETLGSCIGPQAARERFLCGKIDAEELKLGKLAQLPHHHPPPPPSLLHAALPRLT